MISILLPFSLLALTLAAALALFLTLKSELRKLGEKQCLQFELIQTRLREAEEAASEPARRGPALPDPVLSRSGMNLSKRMHATRLLRRGEELTHVAAAIGVPRREVELLVRVHQLSVHRAAAASNQSGLRLPPTGSLEIAVSHRSR